MREFCFSNCCYLSVAALVLTFQLRQMALGLTPPVPEWDPGPRIDDAVRLLAGHSCRMEPADR